MGTEAMKKSGAYVGFLDEYPAGFIQNHRTGFKENWKFQLPKKDNQIQQSSIKNKNFDGSILKKQEEREAQLILLQKKTALKLEKEWIESKSATKEHKYLISKGLENSFDLKIDKFNNLLIPLKDENGKLWSLQRIGENGDKIIRVIKTKEEKERGVEYSAKKKGCFYTQTPLEEHQKFLICEGFATAMTVQLALQKPAIAVVDARNLVNVAQILNQKFPNKQIIIFADNDLKSEIQNGKNVGLASAKVVKDLIRETSIVIPKINIEEAKTGISDFNDIYKKHGLEEVKKQISDCLRKIEIERNEIER